MGRPACPRHRQSKVAFDGHYGPPGRRKQRSRCTPANGDRWHRFTGRLPRVLASHTDECLSCERVTPRHEGPQAPRRYQYTTREVARALFEVGRGSSYR